MDAETESRHESEYSLHLIRQVVTAREEGPVWERGEQHARHQLIDAQRNVAFAQEEIARAQEEQRLLGLRIGRLEDRIQLSDYAVVTRKEEMDVVKDLKQRGKFDGSVYAVCDTASQGRAVHKIAEDMGITVIPYYDHLNPELNRQQ